MSMGDISGRITEDEKLSGLRGWLALACGLLLINGLLLSWVIWKLVVTGFPEEQGGIAVFVMYVVMALLAFTAAYCLFHEKRLGRWLAITYYVICLLLIAGAAATDKKFLASLEPLAVIRSIVIPILWIAYFIVSRRVKRTLVN